MLTVRRTFARSVEPNRYDTTDLDAGEEGAPGQRCLVDRQGDASVEAQAERRHQRACNVAPSGVGVSSSERIRWPDCEAIQSFVRTYGA